MMPSGFLTMQVGESGAAELWRVLTLQAGFNTAIVMAATTLLGVTGGVVGTFAVLRKRALMADALSHSTLPGVGIAFIAATLLGVEGRSLPVLLFGAATTGIVGVGLIHWIIKRTRLTEDVAIGAVLSVMFGIGVVILSYIQSMRVGNQGGLKSFIYGQAAGMSVADAKLIGVIAAVGVVAAVLLLKEFRTVCFDEQFARVTGLPVSVIDFLMMSLVVVVTVVGLQAVGLILVVAMLIIPAVAARFWSDRLWVVVVMAGVFGAVSGYTGAAISAMQTGVPTGAVIVLSAGGVFVVSLLCAPRRGVFAEVSRKVALRARIARDHLLEAMWEFEHDERRNERHDESHQERKALDGHLELARIRQQLGWSRVALTTIDAWMIARGYVKKENNDLRLTVRGRAVGKRVSRNHQLWAQYLTSYAHIAPSHVD